MDHQGNATSLYRLSSGPLFGDLLSLNFSRFLTECQRFIILSAGKSLAFALHSFVRLF